MSNEAYFASLSDQLKNHADRDADQMHEVATLAQAKADAKAARDDLESDRLLLQLYAVGADTARRIMNRSHPNRGRYAAKGRRVVFVQTWSRDCDHCESYNLMVIPATRAALDKVGDDMRAEAEGPYSYHVISPAEAIRSLPYNGVVTDHILAAFEEGEYYNVGTGSLAY